MAGLFLIAMNLQNGNYNKKSIYLNISIYPWHVYRTGNANN